MHYVLVPGAWMGGWIWSEVSSLLRQKGHNVHPITLSGLDDDLDSAKIQLATHVKDVLDYLEYHQLEQVVLVGHSYAGIIVGQVAAQVPKRVAHTVYVEAFLPVDGQSLLQVSGLDVIHEQELIEHNAGLWPAPTQEELSQQPSLNAEQVATMASRLVGHPGQTVVDPVVLNHPLSALPSTFIAGSGWLDGSREADLLNALRRERRWHFATIEGGHWPMVTIPEQLTAELLQVSER